MFKQIRGVVETIVKLALFAFRRLVLYILTEPLLNGLILSWIKQQELIISYKKSQVIGLLNLKVIGSKEKA